VRHSRPEEGLSRVHLVVQSPRLGRRSTKHMFLKTGWNWKRMEGSANVVVHSTAGTVSGGPVSAAPVSGSADLIVADLGGQLRDVVACITDVHLLWKVLFAENNW
jgi:hypothetical protein